MVPPARQQVGRQHQPVTQPPVMTYQATRRRSSMGSEFSGHGRPSSAVGPGAVGWQGRRSSTSSHGWVGKPVRRNSGKSLFGGGARPRWASMTDQEGEFGMLEADGALGAMGATATQDFYDEGQGGHGASTAALAAAVHMAATMTDDYAMNHPMPVAPAGKSRRQRWASMTDDDMFFMASRTRKNSFIPTPTANIGTGRKSFSMQGNGAMGVRGHHDHGWNNWNAPPRRRSSSGSMGFYGGSGMPPSPYMQPPPPIPGLPQPMYPQEMMPMMDPAGGWQPYMPPMSAWGPDPRQPPWPAPCAPPAMMPWNGDMGHGGLPWGPSPPSGMNNHMPGGGKGHTSGQANHTEKPARQQSGWTAVWIGERAFRAHAAKKDEVESLGFSVKIYRSPDKCARALDKRNNIPPTHLFLVSEVDTEQLLKYLQTRNATGLRIIVDAESCANPAETQLLASHPEIPPESSVIVTFSWDEALANLRSVGMTALPKAITSPDSPVQSSVAQEAVLSQEAPTNNTGIPWTLVWVSDQAFKPAAVSQKTRLEGLGCQVKGYKTHKNAARALDKKRALVRTVMLVSGQEAGSLLTYLASRPELATTPVVVEYSSRGGVLAATPLCKVTESFDEAVKAVVEIVDNPDFA